MRAETPVPAASPIILEDFETTTLGAHPFLWKEPQGNPKESTIGVERSALDGDDGNKVLKYEYAFPSAVTDGQGLEAGPMGQALPGSLSAVGLMVNGDGSKNAIALRLLDRQGERFEWQIPITWTGWKKAVFTLDARTAVKTPGSKGNGVLDVPLTLESVRVARLAGGARKGEVMIDNVAAECKFARLTTLYDTDNGVKPEGWKANRNRSVIGLLADSLVPRAGKDVSVLKMEYEYENGADASVEYSKILPAGAGHGTLLAEVFGDGSNNMLRFRMLDGDDRVWQATWAEALVNWSGWKTLYLDTRTLRDPEGRDPGATMEKFPVKFYSLIIDDCSAKDMLPGVESGRKGEIYLGRLQFGSEK